MDLGLRGGAAVLTGVSRGISLAIKRTLIDESDQSLDAAAPTITPELLDTGAVAVTVNLPRKDAGEHPIREAPTALGGVDVPINNTGGRSNNLLPTSFPDTNDEAWKTTWRKNVPSAAPTTHAATPHPVDRCGMMVNTPSASAYHPAPPDHNTPKAALRALGKGPTRTSPRRASTCAPSRPTPR